jgi:iron complex outermembrane receptor protein
LREAGNINTVDVQRRAPVSLDPHIRGFKQGQIYSQIDGGFWVPVRQDLDTMLGKTDSSMVESAEIIPGPYGVRFGPGFSFINIESLPTPRYAEGYESHVRLIGNIRTNGGQLFGRTMLYGGGENWGYRISYGDRKGSDYLSGNRTQIPSSFHNQDETIAIGYDLEPHTHLEADFQRLDQTGTEVAGQFFDVDYLGAFAINLRLVDDDPDHAWSKMLVETWYNRTKFQGSVTPNKRGDFPVITRWWHFFDGRTRRRDAG